MDQALLDGGYRCYTGEKDRCLFQYCDMSAFWQLRTWQRQVI